MTDNYTDQLWFAFRAYNQQPMYGFGTPQQADLYADQLNEGKEINHYHVYPLSDAEANELHLDDNTEAVNLGDEIGTLDVYL